MLNALHAYWPRAANSPIDGARRHLQVVVSQHDCVVQRCNLLLPLARLRDLPHQSPLGSLKVEHMLACRAIELGLLAVMNGYKVEGGQLRLRGPAACRGRCKPVAAAAVGCKSKRHAGPQPRSQVSQLDLLHVVAHRRHDQVTTPYGPVCRQACPAAPT